MFLLFASTLGVEQMDLQLSLESVQSSLVSAERQEDCSTEMVPRQQSDGPIFRVLQECGQKFIKAERR